MDILAKLTLKRDDDWTRSNSDHDVCVNGRIINTIKHNETIDIKLNPGRIDLKISFDRFGSNSLSLDIKKGDHIFCYCQSTTKGWRYLFFSFYLLLLPHKMVFLEQIQDPAEIARLFPDLKPEVES